MLYTECSRLGEKWEPGPVFKPPAYCANALLTEL